MHFGSFSLNKNFGFTLFSDEHSGMCFSFVITHVYRWTRNIEFDLYWRCRTFSASVFSIIYSLSFQEFPTKMNQISGLMITAVAGGGVVTPLLGMALDFAGVTAGLSVILLCVLYLIYCAFGVKIQS